MDDLVLFHHDKEYLKKCLEKINKFVLKEKLYLNDKTQIYNLNNGLPFLGYKFILKNKKLYILVGSKTKRRIKKNLSSLKNDKTMYLEKLSSYNGFLNIASSKKFIDEK